MHQILIIGSGGREHALAWKAAQSPLVDKVFVAPGNAGTAQEAKLENINISAEDISALLDFAQNNQIKLTIVGPEAPLVAGIVDAFETAGLLCFGPHKNAAQLEGSKTFSKDFMARHDIPTASYANFTDLEQAKTYVQQQGTPIVIKASGLAAGKGVIIAMNEQEAIAALEDMLAGNRFGDAGSEVVVEEFLIGEEVSFIALCDGSQILPMATSQDHKARDDGDKGPNTGGMGAYSPAPLVTPQLHERIMQKVMQPTLQGMIKDGTPYRGFLYAGLMISPVGEIKVLEYNCRFGDPETQPIMLRLQSDLVAHCLAAMQGTLEKEIGQWDPRPALGVVMAAGGYPNSYDKGLTIEGLHYSKNPDTKVFHAGTKAQDDMIITNGGRVLCCAALGRDIKDAHTKAYELVSNIHWPKVYYRKDIGYRALT